MLSFGGGAAAAAALLLFRYYRSSHVAHLVLHVYSVGMYCSATFGTTRVQCQYILWCHIAHVSGLFSSFLKQTLTLGGGILRCRSARRIICIDKNYSTIFGKGNTKRCRITIMSISIHHLHDDSIATSLISLRS